MSQAQANYLVISLPQSVTTSAGHESADWLEQGFLDGKSSVSRLTLPIFKLSTLDQLVVQSDELGKIDDQLGAAVAKTIDVLGSVKGNGDFVRKVDDVNVLNYIHDFQWKSGKYRVDKPLKEIITTISQEAFQLDADLKAKYAEYQAAKTTLTSAERKQSGDLTVRSLHDLVSPDLFTETEYLTTQLLVVPKSLNREFQSTYEKLCEYVVPETARLVTSDAEYNLYAVTLFRKFLPEFLHNAREKKFHHREFVYSEQLINDLRDEEAQAHVLERELKNDTIRLASAAYSDVFSAWIHIKVVRVYVESVLRYGLPPDFYSAFLKLPKGLDPENAKKELRSAFKHVGKEGFHDEDGGNGKSEGLGEYAGLVEGVFEPFVLYDLEVK